MPRIKRSLLMLMAGMLNTCLLCLPAWFIRGSESLVTIRVILFLAFVNCWLVVEAMQSRKRQREFDLSLSHPPRFNPCAIALLILFWVALIQGGDGRGTMPSEWWSIATGLAMLLSGIYLRAVAIASLEGRFLDQIDLGKHHVLETRGIYRILRHPSEVGTVLIASGASSLLASPIAAALGFVVLLPLIGWRCIQEDRMLRQRFGDEFDRYARSVPRWFPSIRLDGNICRR